MLVKEGKQEVSPFEYCREMRLRKLRRTYASYEGQGGVPAARAHRALFYPKMEDRPDEGPEKEIFHITHQGGAGQP